MRSLRNFNTNDQKEKLKSMGIESEKAEKYASMSEDELVSELLRSVRKQKADGSFDSKQLQTLASLLSPQLDDKQKSKLNDLVRLLCETE